MYHGHVYNKEGKPICGVRVSDGLNISLTDADGAYELPGWERANLISVNLLTRSHNDWYKMIEAGIFDYDFYVTPYEKEGGSSFLHISDTEIFANGAKGEDWLGFVHACIEEQHPDFLIHTGDICSKPGLEEHYKLLNSDNSAVPVRYTLGNHDYVAENYGEYTYEKYYGPLWYSFDLGNVHYVILPITSGQTPGLYEKGDRAKWLREDLKYMKPGQRLGVFCHTHADIEEASYSVKGDDFILDLREFDILLWTFGHFHINYVNEDDGRYSICTARPDCGGIDGSLAGCRIVRIEDSGKLSTDIIYHEKPTLGKCETRRVEMAGNICFTAPIYADGGIFTASFMDGYPKDCYIRKSSCDGLTLWEYKTVGSVKWNMTYLDGRLYAVDTAGNVYCLDGACGMEIFKTSLLSSDARYFSGGVSTDGARIFVTAMYRMYIIDAKDGHVIATKDTKKIAAAGTVSPYVHENMLIWGKHWLGIHAYDKDTLEEIWFSDAVKDSVAKSIVHNGYIIAPTRYRVVKLSLSGEVVTQSGDYGECTFDTYSEPIVHDGKLYVPTTHAGVILFDAETLCELHRFECGAGALGACPYTKVGERTTLGKPVIIGDELIFCGVDGYVYFYNINTYTLVRKISVGHPILSGPCVIPGGLAVVDFHGGISFIDL